MPKKTKTKTIANGNGYRANARVDAKVWQWIQNEATKIGASESVIVRRSIIQAMENCHETRT